MDGEEGGAVSQLGDLALGHILSDLGIEGSSSRRVGHLVSGGGKQAASSGGNGPLLQEDQIYKDTYEDDDMDLGDLGEEEDEKVDKEEMMRREAQQQQERERYYRMGLAQLKQGTGKVRGEVDDFDEEGRDGDGGDEDAEGEVDETVQLPQGGEAPIKVKEEPMDDDEEEGPITPPTLLGKPIPSDPPDLKQLWPDFEPDKILRFTDLFTPRAPKRRRLVEKRLKASVVREDELPIPASTREDTVTTADETRPSTTTLSLIEALVKAQRLEEKRRIAAQEETREKLGDATAVEQDGIKIVDLDDWEDRIAWNPDEGTSLVLSRPPMMIDRPYNHELARGDWEKSIIWHPDAKYKDFTKLVLDLNDPEMMLESQGGDDTPEKVVSLVRSDAPAMSQRQARVAAGLDPFNLSNDLFYEVNKENRPRSIRQTLGQLDLQHSHPAIRLQIPFYKTRLNKAEARSFHRPPMQFPSNIPLKFSKVRSSKKKREEGDKKSKSKDAAEMLKTTRDLTLKDTSSFVLYEYSEEYPPVLSNLGMGSLLVNYYRKKDSKDEHIPKSDLGEPVVLDVSDESPFMKFGSVEPGRTQPTLYNRMIRAPLFRHKPAQTDFLLVRHTTKDDVRYYLRDIKNLFVVGQTYPLIQVPGPHARLVTNALKHRMQLITYRLLRNSVGQRIKIHRIMKYFPDQNELQMRQRLKEFMEYNRRAGDKDQGYWKLKQGHVPPLESELQAKLPPEYMCLAEAMQAGQRHLLDAGYTRTAEGDEDGDESKMDVEQLLAPWITTKNFLHATQGKAMLKLHGEGDPSGRGEAFSFLRVSMKDIFVRAGETEEERLAIQEQEEQKSGHKYNVARQQQVYKEEIQRIWDAQRKALSNPIPPELTHEDVLAAQQADQAARSQTPLKSGLHARGQSRAGSVRRDGTPGWDRAGTPGGGAVADDGASSVMGVDTNKVLRIRRKIHGRWQTELVREPAVIHAYMRQRQQIEDEKTTTESLVPTGDAALDAMRRRRLEEEIRARKKNQERRLQRKNAKAAAEGIPIPGGAKKLLNKTETKRRCGRCGEVGHMSTNTSCPKYQAPNNMPSIASSASGRMVPTQGSLGGGGGAGADDPANSMAGDDGMGGGAVRPPMLHASSGLYGSAYSVPQSPMTPATPYGGGGLLGGPAAMGAGSPPAAAAYSAAGSPPPQPSTPASGTGTPAPSSAASKGVPKLKIKLKR